MQICGHKVMGRKAHKTEHLHTSKMFFGRFTNRVEILRSKAGYKKLTKALEDSGLEHHLSKGYYRFMIYFRNEDHDKVMDVLNNKVKVKRIESISRPLNDVEQNAMIGDKHLVICKNNIPFKKFRYKVVFKSSVPLTKTNFDFLKTQQELDVVRLSYVLDRNIHRDDGNGWGWSRWYGEMSFYVEDEPTTSMAALLYSDMIKKIYVYKTRAEMTEGTNE
jgi:hypothetical protein